MRLKERMKRADDAIQLATIKMIAAQSENTPSREAREKFMDAKRYLKVALIYMTEK